MEIARFEPVLMIAALLCLGTGCRRGKAPDLPPPTATTNLWFEDITARSGVDFVHDYGRSGSFFMPESIGSGGALLDFDNDGRLDLYLVHCTATNSTKRNCLYHQESDGHFRDVSAGSGLDVTGVGMGVAVGDINNDGLPDVLLTEYGRVRLFLNHGGGKFLDISSAAGIENTRWGTSASFFDYDRDGWLDLVIVNYVDYSPTQKCYDTRGAIEYCGPQGMKGTVTRLFHNLKPGRDGTPQFEDVTMRSGLIHKPGPSLGVLCADFNGDAWPDVFICDDGVPNRLYLNQHDGTFVEEAVVRGIAYTAVGCTAANMGVAFGDVDGDGLFDIFVAHLAWEQHTLWKQGPRGLFQDRTAQAGLGNLSLRGTAFGTLLADFDQDGALDLALVNGLIKRGNHPGPFLAGMDPFWNLYALPRQLFVNDGHGQFREVSGDNAPFCGPAAVGRGLACGDIDNDGALDLVVINTGAPAQLFRNTAPRRGHWLMARVVDPARGGRDAYGSEVTVEAGGRRWWRLVQPGYSYLVSSDPRVHFGLGDAVKVDRIRVLWPDGSEEAFLGTRVDQHLVLRKGGGQKL